LEGILIIVDMFQFWAAPQNMLRETMLLIGDDIVDKLIHAIFALELVGPDTVKTLGIGFDAEHSLFEEHWNILSLFLYVKFFYTWMIL
jgi:hypothetical protein